MGSIEKAATAAVKKVFYVITRRSGNKYRGPERGGYAVWETTIQEANQHTDIISAYEEAARSIRKGNQDTRIVRVEETPGSEERVVLGETQVAPLGSTVKYAVRQDQMGNPFFAGGSFAETVQGARLYSSQADALAGIIENCAAPYRRSLHPTTILRVAVQPSAPKYTETVLA